MKYAFFLVTLLFALSLSSTALAHPSAHVTPAVHVNCHNDQCDGVWPHDTDGSGGSNCLSGFTEPVPSVALKDKDGRTEGTMHFYQSYNCDGAWVTVHADTTYMMEIDFYTYRLHQSWPTPGDDDRTISGFVVAWPDYVTGQWLDNGMVGFEQYDNPPDNDCLHGRVRWEDRYSTWHDVNTQGWCI